jgi:hypothetical protein
MAESDSARTERELAELRGRIDTDIALLRDRVRSDLDVRELARRRPLPVAGGLVALVAVVGAALVRRSATRQQERRLGDIDHLIERLGGRVDRMKKATRDRLRESLRKEIGEVETGDRVQRTMWAALASGLTALAVALARVSVQRFFGDTPPSARRP